MLFIDGLEFPARMKTVEFCHVNNRNISAPTEKSFYSNKPS